MTPEEIKKLRKAVFTKVKFGKYKGERLDKIPSGYLKWIAENLEDEDLAEKASIVYNWRGSYGGHWYESHA